MPGRTLRVGEIGVGQRAAVGFLAGAAHQFHTCTRAAEQMIVGQFHPHRVAIGKSLAPLRRGVYAASKHIPAAVRQLRRFPIAEAAVYDERYFVHRVNDHLDAASRIGIGTKLGVRQIWLRSQ